MDAKAGLAEDEFVRSGDEPLEALQIDRPLPDDFAHATRYADYVRDYREIVVSDPSVMMGKPVIAGTRITVELILEKLAAGEMVEQILEAHPRLNEDAVRAALAFAADALRADVIYPLETIPR